MLRGARAGSRSQTRAKQVAFTGRSLCADIRPSAFRYYRKVSLGQEMPRPARWPRPVTSPLGIFQFHDSGERIWAVTMIRDEVDIIAFTISHLINQGVDRVLVADNNSVDGSLDVVLDLAKQLPVTVVTDREIGYYQAWKMTRLARFAACSGAQWIIPFDADELWVAPGSTLKEFLATTDLDVVKAQMMDYVPQDSDDPTERNPYRRIQHRVSEPRAVSKVLFRAHRLVRVAVGNHTVRHPGRFGGGLEVRHFPYRTDEQLVRKMRQGATALASTHHPDGIGAEWRQGAAMSPADIAAMQGWDRPILLDPAPYSGSWT